MAFQEMNIDPSGLEPQTDYQGNIFDTLLFAVDEYNKFDGLAKAERAKLARQGIKDKRDAEKHQMSKEKHQMDKDTKARSIKALKKKENREMIDLQHKAETKENELISKRVDDERSMDLKNFEAMDKEVSRLESEMVKLVDTNFRAKKGEGTVDYSDDLNTNKTQPVKQYDDAGNEIRPEEEENPAIQMLKDKLYQKRSALELLREKITPTDPKHQQYTNEQLKSVMERYPDDRTEDPKDAVITDAGNDSPEELDKFDNILLALKKRFPDMGNQEQAELADYQYEAQKKFELKKKRGEQKKIRDAQAKIDREKLEEVKAQKKTAIKKLKGIRDKEKGLEKLSSEIDPSLLKRAGKAVDVVSETLSDATKSVGEFVGGTIDSISESYDKKDSLVTHIPEKSRVAKIKSIKTHIGKQSKAGKNVAKYVAETIRQINNPNSKGESLKTQIYERYKQSLKIIKDRPDVVGKDLIELLKSVKLDLPLQVRKENRMKEILEKERKLKERVRAMGKRRKNHKKGSK